MTQTDTSSYPNTNLLIDLNIWYQKIISMILESADQSDFDDVNNTNYPTATRPLVAAQRDYSFNTASWSLLGVEGASPTTGQTLLPLKIKRLDITYDGTNWFPATPLDDGTIPYGIGNDAQLDQQFTNVAPQYSVKYNSIFIYPMATAAQVSAGAMMRLEQERVFIPITSAELTAGTYVPGFDLPFHPMLAEGCALEYGRARNFPQVADWEQSLTDWEARLRTAYGRKELDRRPQMQNIFDDTSFRSGMVGKLQLQIAAPDFLKGVSASDYSSDGGFSPLSAGPNLNYQPGVVYQFPSPTDASTNLVSNLIASCADNGASGVVSNQRYFIDDTANFYKMTSGTLTKEATGSNTYTYLQTQVVGYASDYFASSETDVTLWNGSTSITENWLTSTMSHSGLTTAYPHPLLVYNGFLYIANGNVILQFNGSTITDFAILDSGQIVYALGIDPASGQMLISSQIGVAGNLGNSTEKYIWLWDGVSLTPSRKIPTNELVMSFLNVAGVTYVGMGQYIGYWDGNGVQTIRKLQYTTYTIASFPYKPHMAAVGNTLYYIDGNTVFACGPLAEAQSLWMRVQRVFYPVFSVASTIAANGIELISDLGNGELGIYYDNTFTSTHTFVTLNLVANGSGGANFISNRYEFPRPVQLHRIRVFTTGITTTSAVGQVGVYEDDTGNDFFPAVSNFVVASGNSPKAVFDFDLGGYKCNMAQFIVSLNNQSFGLNRIVVYYDVAE